MHGSLLLERRPCSCVFSSAVVLSMLKDVGLLDGGELGADQHGRRRWQDVAGTDSLFARAPPSGPSRRALSWWCRLRTESTEQHACRALQGGRPHERPDSRSRRRVDRHHPDHRPACAEMRLWLCFLISAPLGLVRFSYLHVPTRALLGFQRTHVHATY